MEEPNLPEEIIVLILTYLPVKSLIRFTCVSRRFHSLILSDPKFAQSQLQAARDRETQPRKLIYSVNGPWFGSLDLETPSFGDPSSVRELQLPFQPPLSYVRLLGSCSGYYLTRVIPNLINNKVIASAVGYFPATDDYKVFIVDYVKAAIFSSRAHAWEALDSHALPFVFGEGILLKEALHWVNNKEDEILAFDLGQEEKHKFRKMLLPRNFNDDGDVDHENHLGVTVGGCLSLARKLYVSGDCIDIWVMGEYGVLDSWTKRFNLKILDPPKDFRWDFFHVLVLETSIVAQIRHNKFNSEAGFIKLVHKEEGKCNIYKVMGLP